MFMAIISMVNNLWINNKISWEDKAKINAYIFDNADDEKLMKKLYDKVSNYQGKNMNLMDLIPKS